MGGAEGSGVVSKPWRGADVGDPWITLCTGKSSNVGPIRLLLKSTRPTYHLCRVEWNQNLSDRTNEKLMESSTFENFFRKHEETEKQPAFH